MLIINETQVQKIIGELEIKERDMSLPETERNFIKGQLKVYRSLLKGRLA